MKLHALLASSGSYMVAKFQLVSAVLRLDITVLQKVSGNRATNCSVASSESSPSFLALCNKCFFWSVLTGMITGKKPIQRRMKVSKVMTVTKKLKKQNREIHS